MDLSFLDFTSIIGLTSVIFTVSASVGTDGNSGIDVFATPPGFVILGSGMIGATSRSRQCKATVTYARTLASPRIVPKVRQ